MVRGSPGLGVLTARATRLEVWGDPIAHSRSPQLHAAAYAVLGLPWSYGRRRVDEASFAVAARAMAAEIAAMPSPDDVARALTA